MLANMYELIMYTRRVYNGTTGMNIDDKYVGIFVSTRKFCLKNIIFQFQTTFSVGFSEQVYNLSIYNVYNKVIGSNISDN